MSMILPVCDDVGICELKLAQRMAPASLKYRLVSVIVLTPSQLAESLEPCLG